MRDFEFTAAKRLHENNPDEAERRRSSRLQWPKEKSLVVKHPTIAAIMSLWHVGLDDTLD